MALRLQGPRPQSAGLAALQNVLLPTVAPVVELLEVLPLLEEVERYVAERDHEELQQLILVLRWEQRRIVDDLEEDATDAPNVDCVVVWAFEDDLWCSVHAALHVAEAELVVLTTRTEVNELDVAELVVDEEDVLWFHVTVDDALVFHEFERLE